MCHFFVLTTFWCPLWSFTEQTHGNLESICLFYYTEFCSLVVGEICCLSYWTPPGVWCGTSTNRYVMNIFKTICNAVLPLTCLAYNLVDVCDHWWYHTNVFTTLLVSAKFLTLFKNVGYYSHIARRLIAGAEWYLTGSCDFLDLLSWLSYLPPPTDWCTSSFLFLHCRTLVVVSYEWNFLCASWNSLFLHSFISGVITLYKSQLNTISNHLTASRFVCSLVTRNRNSYWTWTDVSKLIACFFMSCCLFYVCLFSVNCNH